MIKHARPMLMLAGVVLLGAAAKPVIDPAPVVAAERAFALDERTLGVAGSFLKYSTADAVMIGAGGVSHPKDAFAGAAVGPPEPLAWWPLWAGMAQSGDLGFTTGPVEQAGKRGGHYFTVWKRQADGGWKWIYDGGSGATAAGEAPAATAPIYLPVSTAKPVTPAKAMDDCRAAEKAFADRARTDVRTAFAASAIADARIYVQPAPPAVGSVAIAQALGAYPAGLDFSAPEGGEASKAGDLIYVYGPVTGQGVKGRYVHLWQRRPDGLKLVFAQIVPARG